MNSIQDSLILLAAAQESMTDVAEKLKQLNTTQITIEKSAYESMNSSDDVLNLSKEGRLLVNKLLECCNVLMNQPGEEACLKTKAVLEELNSAFLRISQSSSIINEVAHTIEKNVADQKEIEEGIKVDMHRSSENVNEVIASAEMYLALKDYIF